MPQPDQLSHSTIYSWIESDRQQGGMLYYSLPRFGKKRWKGGKRNKKAGVKLIPNRVDISERPPVVDYRTRIGDWEGDTVHGQNAHLVTLVDRTSRFTLAKRVLRKTKEEVADAMLALFKKVSSVRTVTLDNGGEFADHVRVSRETGAQVYFTKPYASWQRGTNENTNSRIRRFWHKKFDMATLTEGEIEDRIFLLNLTPRKVLGGLTPLEALSLCMRCMSLTTQSALVTLKKSYFFKATQHLAKILPLTYDNALPEVAKMYTELNRFLG